MGEMVLQLLSVLARNPVIRAGVRVGQMIYMDRCRNPGTYA